MFKAFRETNTTKTIDNAFQILAKKRAGSECQIQNAKLNITNMLNINYTIVFIWSRNGAIKTKAFVEGLFAPELNIVGGAVSQI